MEEVRAGPAPKASEADRLVVVDVLRGFALAGLFLVHMLESYELYWSRPEKSAIVDTVFLLFMGKSFTMLALCFGFSFYILMDRAAKRGVDFTRRFVWRLTVLFAIGWVHSVIYRGDIIQLLSAMGLVLLLMHRIKDNRVLIAIAIFCFMGPFKIVQLADVMNGGHFVVWPPMHWDDPSMRYYLHGSFDEVLRSNLWAGQWPKWWFMVESGRLVEILGLYITGMVLGRIGFFSRPADFVRGRWIGFAAATAFAVPLYFARDSIEAWFKAQAHGPAADYLFSTMLGSWFEVAVMAMWALLLIAIYGSAARALVRPFAPLGRLTLTLYVGQSIVFVPVFYHFGLGLWDDWDAATRLWVGLAALAVQMVGAWAWLRAFHYGPLEWLWRAATYLTWQVPFRRKPAPPPEPVPEAF